MVGGLIPNNLSTDAGPGYLSLSLFYLLGCEE